MKKLIFLTIALILSFSMMGCKGKEKKFVGCWQKPGDDDVAVFTKDGKMILGYLRDKKYVEISKGIWKEEGGDKIFMINEKGLLIEGDLLGEYRVSDDGKKLIVKNERGKIEEIAIISFSKKEMVLFDDDKLIKME